MNTQHIHLSATATGRFTLTAMVTAVLLAAAPTGFAETLVPHYASAAGGLIAPPQILPPSEDFPFGSALYVAEGQGEGTHEGLFTEHNEYEVGVQLTDAGVVTVIQGTLTVTSANGDILVWGFSSVTPGIPDPTVAFPFEGSAFVVGGTGRFVNATGSAVTQGILYPDGSYEYVADGLISSIGSNVTN